MEFNLVTKYNTRFIKKFSELNSVIQSYRCKDFSFKQVSGLMGGGGDRTPRTPSPGSATALVPNAVKRISKGNSNTLIASYRCTF